MLTWTYTASGVLQRIGGPKVPRGKENTFPYTAKYNSRDSHHEVVMTNEKRRTIEPHEFLRYLDRLVIREVSVSQSHTIT